MKMLAEASDGGVMKNAVSKSAISKKNTRAKSAVIYGRVSTILTMWVIWPFGLFGHLRNLILFLGESRGCVPLFYKKIN